MACCDCDLRPGCYVAAIVILLISMGHFLLFAWQTQVVNGCRAKLLSFPEIKCQPDCPCAEDPDMINIYITVVFVLQIFMLAVSFILIISTAGLIYGLRSKSKNLIWTWFPCILTSVICSISYGVAWLVAKVTGIWLWLAIGELIVAVIGIYCFICVTCYFSGMNKKVPNAKKKVNFSPNNTHYETEAYDNRAYEQDQQQFNQPNQFNQQNQQFQAQQIPQQQGYDQQFGNQQQQQPVYTQHPPQQQPYDQQYSNEQQTYVQQPLQHDQQYPNQPNVYAQQPAQQQGYDQQYYDPHQQQSTYDQQYYPQHQQYDPQGYPYLQQQDYQPEVPHDPYPNPANQQQQTQQEKKDEKRKRRRRKHSKKKKKEKANRSQSSISLSNSEDSASCCTECCSLSDSQLEGGSKRSGSKNSKKSSKSKSSRSSSVCSLCEEEMKEENHKSRERKVRYEKRKTPRAVKRRSERSRTRKDEEKEREKRPHTDAFADVPQDGPKVQLAGPSNQKQYTPPVVERPHRHSSRSTDRSERKKYERSDKHRKSHRRSSHSREEYNKEPTKRRARSYDDVKTASASKNNQKTEQVVERPVSTSAMRHSSSEKMNSSGQSRLILDSELRIHFKDQDEAVTKNQYNIKRNS